MGTCNICEHLISKLFPYHKTLIKNIFLLLLVLFWENRKMGKLGFLTTVVSILIRGDMACSTKLGFPQSQLPRLMDFPSTARISHPNTTINKTYFQFFCVRSLMNRWNIGQKLCRYFPEFNITILHRACSISLCRIYNFLQMY